MKNSVTLTLDSLQKTTLLAARFSTVLKAGDCLLIEGDIGSGKTAFCRALIQARLGFQEDVPSPTFTLVQTYDANDVTIWHCDLYRLTDPDEALELGLDEAFESAICLIEWPDRLGDLAPKSASHLTFSAHDEAHSVTFLLSDNLNARFNAS